MNMEKPNLEEIRKENEEQREVVMEEHFATL
jgi:hypothetical protein